MIDQELDQLSRALIAATDRLNSEDFRARQARYIALEQEFLALGSELEAEEKAVEAAQAALTSYVNGNYLDLGGVADEAEGPSEMVAGLLFGEDRYVRIDDDGLHDARAWNANTTADFHALGSEITPLPTEEDEYATAKANGALS